MFITFIIAACTSRPNKKVDVTPIPLVKDSRPKIIINQNEDIDEYGPSFGQSDIADHKTDPNIAVIFMPALYATYKYLGFLKFLEENNIKPNAYIASGIPSILLSSYLKSRSLSRAEWVFYKRFQKDHTQDLFSGRWIKEWLPIIEKEFSKTNLEQLETLTLLPQFDPRKRESKLVMKGKLSDHLKNQLNLSPKQGAFLSGIHSKINYLEKLKEFGVDIVIVVDALGSRVNLKHPKDYLLGVFQSQINSKNLIDLEKVIYIDLSTNEDLHDYVGNANSLIRNGKEKSKIYLSDIELRIKDWQESKGKL